MCDCPYNRDNQVHKDDCPNNTNKTTNFHFQTKGGSELELEKREVRWALPQQLSTEELRKMIREVLKEELIKASMLR